MLEDIRGIYQCQLKICQNLLTWLRIPPRLATSNLIIYCWSREPTWQLTVQNLPFRDKRCVCISVGGHLVLWEPYLYCRLYFEHSKKDHIRLQQRSCEHVIHNRAPRYPCIDRFEILRKYHLGSKIFTGPTSRIIVTKDLESDGDQGGPDLVFVNGTKWSAVVFGKTKRTAAKLNLTKLLHARLGNIAPTIMKAVIRANDQPLIFRWSWGAPGSNCVSQSCNESCVAMSYLDRIPK